MMKCIPFESFLQVFIKLYIHYVQQFSFLLAKTVYFTNKAFEYFKQNSYSKVDNFSKILPIDQYSMVYAGSKELVKLLDHFKWHISLIVMISFIISCFYRLSFNNSPLIRIKILDYDEHDDYEQRRIIIGCILFHNETTSKIILKVSKNDAYIPEYKKETSIYKKLKKNNAPNIMNFYGCCPNDSLCITDFLGYLKVSNLQINGEKIPPFKIRGGNIHGAKGNRFKSNTYYYYFSTEWNEKYNSYRNVISKFPVKKRNEAIKEVLKTLGNLNKNYGFYHGDFHDENVFISSDPNVPVKVKHMDFDNSGFINDDTPTLTERDVIFHLYLYNSNQFKSLKNIQERKNFLFLFDVYRFWCHIMWNDKQKRYDTITDINKIIVNNGSIYIKLSSFSEFLISCHPSQQKIENRKIVKLIQVLSLYLDVKEDINKTLMHADILDELYKYVLLANKRLIIYGNLVK